MRKIEYLIIHCSDSDFGNAKIIKKWHVQGNGWRDIGYHYVVLNGSITNKQYDITKDGKIETGRNINNDVYIDSNEQGAHVKFYNKNSIGICLIGKNKFSPKQFESLYYIVNMYKKLIPNISILGHYELDNKKTCPNVDMNNLRKFLNQVLIFDYF